MLPLLWLFLLLILTKKGIKLRILCLFSYDITFS